MTSTATLSVLKMRDMSNKKYTKRAMVLFSSFRLPAADVVLLRKAATREDVSQSEFLRRAVRERAARVVSYNEPKGASNE